MDEHSHDENGACAQQIREALELLGQADAFAYDIEPLTGLPGGVSVRREVAAAMREKRPQSVVRVDLDQLQAFNTAHGPLAGNRLIRLTGECLIDVLEPGPDSGHFVGHLGGDDLVFLCAADEVRARASAVAERFDGRVRELFRGTDLDRGFYVAIDRQGGPHRHPITTLSMGGVDLTRGAYTEPFQVLEACASVMVLAKAHARSCLFIDRRGPGR